MLAATSRRDRTQTKTQRITSFLTLPSVRLSVHFSDQYGFNDITITNMKTKIPQTKQLQTEGDAMKVTQEYKILKEFNKRQELLPSFTAVVLKKSFYYCHSLNV